MTGASKTRRLVNVAASENMLLFKTVCILIRSITDKVTHTHTHTHTKTQVNNGARE